MKIALALLLSLAALGCGVATSPGEQGPPGPQGPPGANGADGAPGANGSPGLGFASGKRLKVQRVIYKADGAAVALALRDSKLGVLCSLARAEDGVDRCLPSTTWLVRYLDDTCAGPAATHSTCGKPSFAAEQTVEQACASDGSGVSVGSVKLVREVLGPIDPPAKVWSKNQITGGCEGVSDLPAGAWWALSD